VTADAAPQLSFRRQQLVVLAMWIVIGAVMVRNAVPALHEWTFPDPDDPMRLMQVRDWLAGQNWFDVTQYRLNPPAGGPMHWSRLVDIPIAAVILVARPFVGQHGAENAALIAVPLLTLAVAMLLIHRITYKLMGTPAALLAVLATPASLGAMKQMRIMRIDHHGWQIVLALVAMLAALDKRPRRSGLVAGTAMALWCIISIEALPFVAAIGAWFAIQWLADASAGERLKSYLMSLAGASLLLFGLTHAPSVWLGHPHDALNVAHLVGFSIAAAASHFAIRESFADLKLRLAALAGFGVVALAAMFAVDPHFLSGPFSSLDPLVAREWYQGVDEGMPVWRVAPADVAAGFAQPLVGLLGAWVAIRNTEGEQRKGWIAFAYLLGAVTLSAVFVIREVTTASTISLPGTAFLCDLALRRARNVSLAPARVLATTGAVFIMAPAYAAPALVMPADPRLVNAMNMSDYCLNRSQIDKLDVLPPSNLAIPLDITPAIVASSHHKGIAGGYHRNGSGIRDVILIFAGPLSSSREILAKRHINYVVMCQGAAESIRWANRGPGGLASLLNNGRTPDWLEPVAIPGLKGLQVWRVRRDRLILPAA